MKVICKSTKDYSDSEFWMGSLTIGREYDTLDLKKVIVNQDLKITINSDDYISPSEYMIMNDYGFEHLYPVKCFVTKQELREEKLNELGI